MLSLDVNRWVIWLGLKSLEFHLDVGSFCFLSPPQNSTGFCNTVRWAAVRRRGVCNISGLTTLPLLPWKPDCSISPLSHSCSSLARCWAYVMCHRREGPVTSVLIIYMEIGGIVPGIFLPATLRVCACSAARAHTHARVHKLTKSALWRTLQVWPGKDTHNI